MFGLEKPLVRGYTVLEIGLANDFATTTMVIHYLLYITFEVVLLSISTLLAAISVLLSSFEEVNFHLHTDKSITTNADLPAGPVR